MSSKDRSKVVRRALKAGSWYEADPKILDKQLTDWLDKAGQSEFGPAKAIISPHAGYEHCGSCAAFAYKEIAPEVSRIFILGPSHNVRLDGIALSSATIYETPIGNLTIDRQVYDELYKTDLFREMNIDVDEEEHSIELQLPFITKVMKKREQPFTIVPMMVGYINKKQATSYGKVFSSYLAKPENSFIISSDFCHWGRRFDYQHYEKSWGKIYQSIEKLDKLGMKSIKDLTVDSFITYLEEYGNTICGSHPILVLIATVQHLHSKIGLGKDQPQYLIKFLNYLQSNHCHSMNDSSVSYVAASLKEFKADRSLDPVQDIVDV